MGHATRTYSSAFELDNTYDVALPLCRTCARRITARWWLIALGLLIAIAAVSTTLAINVTFKSMDSIGGGVLFGTIGFVAAIVCLATIPAALTRPYRFKFLDRRRNVMKLSTQNPDFTRILIQQVQDE
jgi:hypothetical protein